jgi:hypothetical protein
LLKTWDRSQKESTRFSTSSGRYWVSTALARPDSMGFLISCWYERPCCDGDKTRRPPYRGAPPSQPDAPATTAQRRVRAPQTGWPWVHPEPIHSYSKPAIAGGEVRRSAYRAFASHGSAPPRLSAAPHRASRAAVVVGDTEADKDARADKAGSCCHGHFPADITSIRHTGPGAVARRASVVSRVASSASASAT